MELPLRCLVLSAIACVAGCSTGNSSDSDALSEPQDAPEVREKIERAISDPSFHSPYANVMRSLNLKRTDQLGWRTLAWECAYQIPDAHEGVETRYRWIRHGVLVLLELADQTKQHPAVLFDLGMLLMRRIGGGMAGQHDDSSAFRDLFRKDRELHTAIAGKIDLSSATARDGSPEPHLVAEAWFRRMEAEIERDPSREMPIMTLLAHSFAPRCRMQYAHVLDGEGRSEDAAAAWKEADRAWREYGGHPFSMGRDLLVRMDDSDDEWARRARTIANYDLWARVIADEQSEPVRKARRLIFEAQQSLPSKDEAARAEIRRRYDDAFRLLSTAVSKRNPEESYEWFGKDVLGEVATYQRELLDGARLPQDFPLLVTVNRWEAVAREWGSGSGPKTAQ